MVYWIALYDDTQTTFNNVAHTVPSVSLLIDYALSVTRYQGGTGWLNLSIMVWGIFFYPFMNYSYFKKFGTPLYEFTKWETVGDLFLLLLLLCGPVAVWIGFYFLSTLKDAYFIPVEEEALEEVEEEDGAEPADDELDNDLDASAEW